MTVAITRSTVPALKRNLVAALKAKASGVQVVYGDPGDAGRKEQIRMGPTTTADSEPAGLREGRRRRYEEYDLEVHVEVIGGKPEACEDRAFELAGLVESLVSDDPRVTETENLLWVRMAGFEADTTETTDGARCEIEMILRAKGNLL